MTTIVLIFGRTILTFLASGSIAGWKNNHDVANALNAIEGVEGIQVQEVVPADALPPELLLELERQLEQQDKRKKKPRENQ